MAGVIPCTVGCGSGAGGGGSGGCASSLDATLVRHVGTGSVNILAGARSVTATVIGGSANISIAGGLPVSVPAGWSQTWEGSNCGDNILSTFSFSGIDGSSDFTIATVRE